MKDLLLGLLGETRPHDFLHALVWALVGAALSLLLHAVQRDPQSTTSPLKFHWGYFLYDNARRVLTTLLLIIVALRFAPEFLGIQLSGFTALLVGFGNDKIAQGLKTRGLFDKKAE